MVKSLPGGRVQKHDLKDKKKKVKGGFKDAKKKQNTKDKKKTKNLQRRIEETEKLTTKPNLVSTNSKKGKRKLEEDIKDESPDKKVEFTIPSADVGKVIGKGGSIMKRITQESGARIHLEEMEEGKTCTISGSDESVKKAKTMIDECLKTSDSDSTSEELSLLKKHVGKIIGNGGKRIAHISSKTGVVIRIEKSKVEGRDSICHITGSKVNVKKARSIIENLLNDQNDSTPRKRSISENNEAEPKSKKTKASTTDKNEQVIITIPNELAIKVIGKEGSVLKKIMQKSGARIYFEKKKNEREDRICKIAGSEVSISKAKAMIEDIRNRKSEPPNKKVEFTIPSANVGKVIGKGGSIMKRITQESGARIHLEEIEEGKTCTISGSDESVKKAKTMIDECLNVLKVADSDKASDELSILKEKMGRIIGKGGKSIARIRSKTGATVWIVKSEVEGEANICHIKGSEKSVRKARRMIEMFMNDEKPNKTVKPGEETTIEDDRIVRSVDEESDMSDTDEEEEPDSNVEVPILVSSSCVQTLLDDSKFKKLQTESIAKIVIDKEEDQEESFCRISGEEKDVMETKNKLEKLLQKVEKKEKKEKPTLQIASSLTWDTEFKLPKTNKGESSSEDSDEEEVQKPVKKTKGEKRREKLEEEKQLYEYERKKLEGEIIPETADDFDRLVVNSPDSSVVWLRYMAFHLETSEFDKARSVAERALKTISFREEREKQNIWVAYLNLENMYGTNETIGKVLARAITQCEPLDVYLPMVDIYVDSSKIEEAERLYSVMTKKYSTNKMVWTKFAEFFFQQNRPDSARKLLQRALKSLENRHHVETITKFAQMEFKHGEPERGKTMFENVLNTYPKRTDIWSVYVDLLTKMKDHEVTRSVYKRMIGLKLAAKKIKFFFKKYLEFEEKYGNESQIAEVKEKALQYVESGGTID